MGAGKSTALASFRRHGAATVSSDEIVHHLLANEPEVKSALVERLGEDILGDDGAPDRERIARRVFKDRDALDFLEKLLHPLVSREYLQWREQLAQLPNPPQVCVTEVPLLYEVGGEKRFDKVVVITAPSKLREARRGGRKDDRESASSPRPREGEARRLRLREHGHAGGARRVGGGVMATLSAEATSRNAAGKRQVTSCHLSPTCLLRGRLDAVPVSFSPRSSRSAVAAAWTVREEPDFYLRARYPLEYEHVIRGARGQPRPRPGADRGDRLRREPIRPERGSAAGAIGLMQLLPDTAKGIALRTGGDGFVVADLRDPEINVRYGSWYLDHLRERYRRPRSRACRVPRGPRQRRPLARGGARHRVRRRRESTSRRSSGCRACMRTPTAPSSASASVVESSEAANAAGRSASSTPAAFALAPR